jgi:serine/threonine-protein kinase
MTGDSLTVVSAPLAKGAILGDRYRIEGCLGKGGMGLVLAATHLELEMRVAVKLLASERTGDARAVARFRREIRASAKLRGPHVARVFDAGTTSTGTLFMVQELLEGSDVAKVLRERGKLTVEEAATYVHQACEAVAEAHAIGIVHRDLKPDNLFLARSLDGAPVIKVLDFGLAKVAPVGPRTSALTKANTVLGSPDYMSPEQMNKPHEVDHRTDIWSLGITLYELVSGTLPFAAETVTELFLRVMSDTPRPLCEVAPDVPEPFARAVMRCLARRCEDRFQSVRDLAAELAPYTSGAPSREAPRADTRPVERPVAGILDRTVVMSVKARPSSKRGAPRWLVAAATGLVAVVIFLAAAAGSRVRYPSSFTRSRARAPTGDLGVMVIGVHRSLRNRPNAVRAPPEHVRASDDETQRIVQITRERKRYAAALGDPQQVVVRVHHLPLVGKDDLTRKPIDVRSIGRD